MRTGGPATGSTTDPMRDQVIELIERNVAAGEYRDRLLAHARGLDDDWYRGVHGDPFTAIVADYARHRLEPSSTMEGEAP